MKQFALLAILACTLSTPAFAAGKPCDELKSMIEGRLQEHGVKAYSLDIVAKGEAKDGKVVGTCEGGSKEIVYKRK